MTPNELRHAYRRGKRIGPDRMIKWSWSAGGSDLRFAPPAMSNPWVYQAASGEEHWPTAADVTAGRAYVSSNNGLRYYNKDLDVVLKLPTTQQVYSGTGRIFGGRHVRVIGGDLVGQGQSAMLVFELQTGSVFIEGTQIDAASGWTSTLGATRATRSPASARRSPTTTASSAGAAAGPSTTWSARTPPPSSTWPTCPR